MSSPLPHELRGCWAVSPLHMPFPLTQLDVFRPARQAVPITYEPGKSGRSIAIIKALGLLTKSATWYGTSTLQLRNDVRNAANDPNVSGILIAIDSPGGTVAGVAEMIADVKAARKRKPVWVQIQDLGASAAYALASQADLVYANAPSALVGSIGTMIVVYDESVAAEQAGVKALLFATGPLKGAGWPGVPVTDEQKDMFSRAVQAAQQGFDAAVRSGRGLSASELEAVKTGEAFPALDALRLKLIDGVQPLEQTLSELAKAS